MEFECYCRLKCRLIRAEQQHERGGEQQQQLGVADAATALSSSKRGSGGGAGRAGDSHRGARGEGEGAVARAMRRMRPPRAGDASTGGGARARAHFVAGRCGARPARVDGECRGGASERALWVEGLGDAGTCAHGQSSAAAAVASGGGRARSQRAGRGEEEAEGLTGIRRD